VLGERPTVISNASVDPTLFIEPPEILVWKFLLISDKAGGWDKLDSGIGWIDDEIARGCVPSDDWEPEMSSSSVFMFSLKLGIL
jgi:hypothetical protein